MANASSTAENQALDGIEARATSVNLLAYVGAHSASPGTSGANEITDAGYARQACSWNAASGGSKTNSSSMTFTTAGTTPITDLGTRSAATGGTYGIGIHLASSVTAATITVAAGALTLSAS